jgi:hypothetical protein
MHNEELHNLYASLNVIRVTRSRRMRLVGHVAPMREVRNANKILVGKLKDLGVDGKIILELMFGK